MGDQDIPYSHYTSKDYAAREMEKPMAPCLAKWRAVRSTLLSLATIRFTTSAIFSALVTRTESMEIKCLRQRLHAPGNSVETFPGDNGFGQSFRCPFSWLDLFPRW